MAVGYSAKLPLKQGSSGENFGLNETLTETVKQNVKMLILTSPGERVRDVNFGVGLKRFFFRPMNTSTFGEIATAIREQFNIYFPFLNFSGVQFETKEQDQTLDHNQIKLKVFYTIPSIGESDSVDVIEYAAN